ncbi:hypothetical protein EOM71_00940, partial [Candidatus Falkowbacteria bacterium]|nr:hypothetical protein [Candidatus Falkowbacteria bacterium]
RIAKPVRIQGAFVGENEIKRVVNYIKARSGEPQYLADVVEKHNVPDLPNGGVLTNNQASDGDDDLLEKAKGAVINSGRASATYLQRMFKIGYPRAASLLDQLEEQGVIGPVNGAKAREIYISPEEYNAQKSQPMSGQPLHNPANSQAPDNFLGEEIWSEDKVEIEADDDQLPLASTEQILADIYSEEPVIDDAKNNDDEDNKNKSAKALEFDDDEDQEKYFSQ